MLVCVSVYVLQGYKLLFVFITDFQKMPQSERNGQFEFIVMDGNHVIAPCYALNTLSRPVFTTVDSVEDCWKVSVMEMLWKYYN